MPSDLPTFACKFLDQPGKMNVPLTVLPETGKAEKITVGADAKSKRPRKMGESLRYLINAGRRI